MKAIKYSGVYFVNFANVQGIRCIKKGRPGFLMQQD